MKIVNVSASEVLNANILIVDEHDTNAIPLRRLLNNAGYRNVSFTDDFHGVIHLHRKFHYDLMLVNLQMPGIDDADVVRGLQRIERECSLPVLVIIGKSVDALRVLPAGTKDFIRKPFDMLEVKTRIHNMLVMRFLDRKIESIHGDMESIIQQRIAGLQESEARFRSLVELSSDWYWEQDKEGNFTKTSGPVFEMLGLAGGFFTEARHSSFFHRAGGERDRLDSHLAARRPFIDHAYRVIQPDGSCRYLRVSGEPIFDATGCFAGYRGVGVDVTEQVHMEEEMACFHKISERSDHAILFIDNHDMRLLDVNEIASDLWGYSREEFRALSFSSIVCNGQEELFAANEEHASSQDGWRGGGMVRLKHKDGSPIPAEMLCRNSMRSGESGISVMFVHKRQA